MAMAIALILLVIGSVAFHFWSPWWFTPIASNWGAMDDTVTIAFVVTGVVFVAVSLFMAYSVIRYRHKDGAKAAFEPENKKLEWWLIGLTTVGVIAMLAPGLKVWNEYVTVPEDAAQVEAMGQQWKWSYRFPGADGELGTVDPRKISTKNPYGINPDDPNGQDDILAAGGELHLPIGQPVKMLLRSRDVLHDFYVPQIRAKMDLVPGIVTFFWFTPIRTGRFDVLCAELCGVGHYNMRSHLVIDEQDDFEAWLAAQPTFAQTMTGGKTKAPGAGGLVAQGRALADENGCVACHSLDGAAGIGPSWQGLLGRVETLTDGTEITVDEAYIRESIRDPGAKLVKGFDNMMPAFDLSDGDIAAIIALTRAGDQTEDQDTSGDQGSLAEQGRQLAEGQGCVACHTTDGGVGIGPGWQGMFGRAETLADGTTVVIDEAYIGESIRDPAARLVKGFDPMMPAYELSDADMAAVIAYLKSLSD